MFTDPRTNRRTSEKIFGVLEHVTMAGTDHLMATWTAIQTFFREIMSTGNFLIDGSLVLILLHYCSNMVSQDRKCEKEAYDILQKIVETTCSTLISTEFSIDHGKQTRF
jgi:hypothetical protein